LPRQELLQPREIEQAIQQILLTYIPCVHLECSMPKFEGS
jgi:hypothetical protein